MLNKTLLLLGFCIPLFSSADIVPENILSANCLKHYKQSYQSSQTHKAFCYARESDTGNDKCDWAYGNSTLEEAKSVAMKQCASHMLNAECKIVDEDGKFIAKEGDFSSITQPDNTPLSSEQTKLIMQEAQTLAQGNCLPFFKKYLSYPGHKVFAYSIDANGKYACGEMHNSGSVEAAQNGAIAACKNNISQRGTNAPQNPCRVYAEGNKNLLKAADFGITITEKSDTYLSSEAYHSYLNKAKEIIHEGPCLFQMKYYLRGNQHKAFFLAQESTGKQACGKVEGAFSPQIAKEQAIQACKLNVKKKQLKATCKLYAQNFDIVAKPEDFGIIKGKEDYADAIFRGNIVKIKQYVTEGADVNMIAKDGMTPLFIAAVEGDETFFNILIAKGADINHKANDKSSLLFAAVLGEKPTPVRYLLDKGFDINEKGRKGNTLLHAAFKTLNTYMIELLMQEGADASIRNDDNISGYDLGKKWKLDLDALKTMDISRKKQGCTQVFYAAQKGDIVALERLAVLKADMNMPCDDGMSSLAYAKNDEKVIRTLVNLGADVNAQDTYGETPLMYAASAGFSGELEKVKLLLTLGANKTLKNKKGQTAYEKIKDQKSINEEIKAVLK